MKAWVNDLNTTAYRIVISCGMAALFSTLVLIAMAFRDWVPKAGQITVLAGLLVLVLTMMGFDVIQYIGARWTNTEFTTARKGAQPAVNVEGPSTVNVASTTPAPVVPDPAAQPPVQQAAGQDDG